MKLKDMIFGGKAGIIIVCNNAKNIVGLGLGEKVEKKSFSYFLFL